MKKVVLIVALLVFAIALFVFVSSDNDVEVPTPDAGTETEIASSTSATPTTTASSVPPLRETSWVWTETIYEDDSAVTPDQPGSFVLSFIDESQFGAQTDCNNVRGSYSLTGAAISFEPMATTRMACRNDVQEGEFVAMLEVVEEITVDSEDRLMLALPSGTMVFTAL